MGSLDMAMPSEYKAPLSELHDRAKTFDTTTVHTILKSELSTEELGRIERVSEWPVASASVAQVHTALLDGKKKVAIKVQKPNIRIQNHWDLLMYKMILAALEYSFDIPMLWTYDYVKQQLESELDFTIEANNAIGCRNALETSRVCKDVAYVPETYCRSKRVLVTEWVEDAVKITDVDKIASMGLDSQAVVRDATSVFAYQIFGTGSVHCDPHPGNLLVRVHPHAATSSGTTLNTWWGWLRGEGWGVKQYTQHQVVLIDHGLYVHMNPALKTQYVKFWMAMINGDDEELSKLCSEWGIHDSELFANMTLMRRRKRKPKATPAVVQSTTIVKGMSNSGKYENEEGEDRRHGAVSDVSSDMSSEERAKRSAERQMRLKERVKHLLKDTSEFPHELGFVNRSVNYIRATNWAHGSPIDRVALFADAAARADVGDEGRVGQWSVASEMSVVGMRLHLLLELWGLNWWGLGKPKESSDRATASTTVGVGVGVGTTAVPQASSLWR